MIDDLVSQIETRFGELEQQLSDPAVIADPLYLDDPAARTFVPLDAALHARLLSGAFRL